MATIVCKQCGTDIGAPDIPCAQCGTAQRKANPPAVWVVVVLIFIGFILTIVSAPPTQPPPVNAKVPNMPALPETPSRP
jgi:hypothetical protein